VRITSFQVSNGKVKVRVELELGYKEFEKLVFKQLSESVFSSPDKPAKRDEPARPAEPAEPSNPADKPKRRRGRPPKVDKPTADDDVIVDADSEDEDEWA
jgi:hypothetical protein